MKKIALLVFCLSLELINSQTKRDPNELAEIIENQKSEILELSKQNTYFKDTLNMLKSQKSSAANNLKFDILNIVGDKKGKALTIYYTITNTDNKKRKSYSPNKAYFIDPQGNAVSTTDMKMSSNQKGIDNIEPNIPVKGSLKFNIEELDIPIVKIIDLKFSNSNVLKDGQYSNVSFQNIPVIWK